MNHDGAGAKRERVIFCWSGGKDSALALHALRQAGDVEIRALLTTVSEDHDRICMHGVRRELLLRQAEALGVPVVEVRLAAEPTNKEYERKMAEALLSFKAEGITRVAFGDIFLEDLKQYRDRQLASIGMTGIYPIWKQDSRSLIERFVRDGFRAALVCVDLQALPERFLGRDIDASFLADLPQGVDPCGENGEYHSFVYEGPIFRNPIPIRRGDIRRTERFLYRDVMPAAVEAS